MSSVGLLVVVLGRLLRLGVLQGWRGRAVRVAVAAGVLLLVGERGYAVVTHLAKKRTKYVASDGDESTYFDQDNTLIATILQYFQSKY